MKGKPTAKGNEKTGVDKLSQFLMDEYGESIGRGGSEGAVDLAIRLIRENAHPKTPVKLTTAVEANATAMLIEVEQRIKTTDDILSTVEESLTGENIVRRADNDGAPICSMGILARIDHIMCVAITAEDTAHRIMVKLGVGKNHE